MKAHVYQERIALDGLETVELPDPRPGPHDVVLRMRAVTLNYRDLAIARGHYHIGVTPPLVPLSDGAGEVVQVGEKVTRFRLGELACPTYLPDWIDGPVHPSKIRRRLGGPTDGVLRELVCLHEEAAVRAPRALDATEAAALPIVAATAWHSLHQLGTLRPGETLLVQGTGALSLTALALGRMGGARVIALTRSSRYEQRLRDLGASDVVTSGGSSTWPEEVMERTAGTGVEVAVDVVGGASLARTVAAMRVGGHVHVVGYTADTSAVVDIFDAIRHAVTFHVATAGSRTSLEAAIRAYDQHAARPVIDRVFPLSRLRDAFDYLAAGGHFGKVAIELP